MGQEACRIDLIKVDWVPNTEDQAVTLELTLRDDQGQVVDTRTIDNFPARGHLAQFIFKERWQPK